MLPLDGGGIRSGAKLPGALRPGDVVNIPPNVKHCTGQGVDSAFQHLAVEGPWGGFPKRVV